MNHAASLQFNFAGDLVPAVIVITDPEDIYSYLLISSASDLLRSAS